MRAAVIGAGQISAEHLRFLQSSSAAHLAGVCDLSEALAHCAADRFKADAAFTDHRRMLEVVRPDVVHVLTPPHTHCGVVADCLMAGAHVIVEKPVAPTNGEFRALWELSKKQERLLTEDHNCRFNEPFLAIEEMVAGGQLGEVREVEVRRALPITGPGSPFADENVPNPCHRLPAGALHDLLPHQCYLALRFMPAVERVAVRWFKHTSHPLFVHDGCDALIFGGGVHARIVFSSDQQPAYFTVSVRGTKGCVETDLSQPYLKLMVERKGGRQLSPLINQWVNGLSLARASVTGLVNKIRRKTLLEGIQTFLDRTYDALRSGNTLPVTFEDMDGATRLLDAMLAEENRIW